VDHGVQLGARLVWLPTFSAANHINAHANRKEGFPVPTKAVLETEPISAFEAQGCCAMT